MLIPETKREREAEGIVTHIGPECTKVKVGDKVLVPKRNAGTSIEFDGETYEGWCADGDHGLGHGDGYPLDLEDCSLVYS